MPPKTKFVVDEAALRAVMQEKGITVQQLAATAGLTVNHVNKLCFGETENPSLNTVFKVISALQVPIDRIIKEIDITDPPAPTYQEAPPYPQQAAGKGCLLALLNIR